MTSKTTSRVSPTVRERAVRTVGVNGTGIACVAREVFGLLWKRRAASPNAI